jgi:hypothetical protein
MKTKTNIKSGLNGNHNETLARSSAKRSLRVKSGVKAGVQTMNHNETLVRA